MLCSNCSRVMKPVVAIDVDGTLGDYHAHLTRFAAVYLNHPEPEVSAVIYDGSQPFSHWFCEWFECDLRTFRDIKLAYRQGAQKRSLPLYPFADGFTKRLQDMGAEVWITTTRPYNRLDNIDPDTRAWLSRHGNTFDYALFDDDKYHELAKRVHPVERVIAVLDDLPEQFTSAVAIFGADVPIFRRNRYNKAAQSPVVGAYEPSVLSLLDALQLIKGRIDAWKEQYPNGR